MTKEELYTEFYKELSEQQQELLRKILNKARNMQQIISNVTEYVNSLNSGGLNADIYESVRQEILLILKGEDNERERSK